MTNKQLSIILKLRDEATKRLQGVRGALQRFANSWKKNWLAITAAVTAAIMALRKAWDLMQLGAKAEQIEESFNRMAESVGISSEKMRQALMEASNATVNFSNVADKASALMAQGLNMDTIAALMKQARVEAKIFGTTTEAAFQNITSAVTGGLVTTLRRTYGLQLSLKDAVEDYARVIGKSAEEVKKYHMAQALANHILDKSKSHLAAVNLEVMSNYEKVQKLKAQWLAFAENLGQALWHVLGFIQGFMNQIVSGFFTLLEVAGTVFQKLLVPLIKFYEVLGKLPGHMGEVYRQSAESIRKLSNSIETNKKVFEMAATESARVAMEQYDLVFAKVKDTGDKTAEILKKVARQVGESAKEAGRQFNAMHELVKQTARNMQSAFSNLFFKAFTGELRSLKEVFADFGRTMLQTISQILAKIVMIKMLTAFAGGAGGSIFGVPVGSLFHEGGMVRRRQNRFVRAHQGLAPDEVPIIAQTGEGILSRRGMNALGGPDNLKALNRGEGVRSGGVTININQVIQAWDAQDVWRNRKMLSEAIADDIYSNGKIRSVIRSYT
jgi:hypothetical protein